MKIYYFSHYDILRARTNQIGDTRLCEGFAENGCEVELIVPYIYRKDNFKKKDALDAYGIRTKYRLRILKTFFPDQVSGKWFMLILVFFQFFLFWIILFKNRKELSDVIIMSRDPNLLLLPIYFKKILRLKNGPKVISWVHEVRLSKKAHLKVYLNADGVVGTCPKVTKDLQEYLKIPQSKLAYSLNPITETQLKQIISKEEARKKINYHEHRPLIVYTGKITKGGKGEEIKYILQTAALLPRYQFYLTGGNAINVNLWKNYCHERNILNVFFTGFILDYTQIVYYQFAADVLVSYYSTAEHDVRYNLPNKICEYMLTRNPIVTCNFPALKGTLSANAAIFVEPENPAALALGIKKAVDDKDANKKLTSQAFEDVQQITFKKRTRVLLDFFKTL